MTPVTPVRSLPWDWYPGTIPDNVRIDVTAFVETTYSFHLYRSEAAVGVTIGRGAATYLGTMFDVGQCGQVHLGDYALVHGAWIICEGEVEIGDYALISWNVVIMDSYRASFDPAERRRWLERVPSSQPRRLLGQESARPGADWPQCLDRFRHLCAARRRYRRRRGRGSPLGGARRCGPVHRCRRQSGAVYPSLELVVSG